MKTIKIGRSKECDIIIENSNISRVHAEVSLVGGQYVYRDVSKNGSTLNGEHFCNRSVTLAPGASLLMANAVPLPWAQIYTLLPTTGLHVGQQNSRPAQHTASTVAVPGQPVYVNPNPVEDKPSVGWSILGLLIPLVGLYLYLIWNSETPVKAYSILKWSVIGFSINAIWVLLLM